MLVPQPEAPPVSQAEPPASEADLAEPSQPDGPPHDRNNEEGPSPDLGRDAPSPEIEEETVPVPPDFAPRETGADAAPTATADYSHGDDDYSQFEHEPPFRRRRNTLKLWTAAAAAFALLALGTVAAVSYWGLPDWIPITRPTFARAAPDLTLDFPPEKQDRRTLPNGTEFFGASGTVTNVGSNTREVPSILIVLRDGRERIVYSWEVAPPKRSLAPGESVTINEAVTDVPRSAKFAEIGWKPS